MKHLERWRKYLIPALVAAAVVAFCLPMFSVPGGIASGDLFRDNDWLNCRSFDLMTRQAVLQHGQLPLRSHLVGGGFPTIAHPSDGSWAPTALAVLLLGDVLGVKVNVLAALLLGCWGVFGLARRFLGLGRLASLYAALLFGFAGWLPSMLLVGFYNQLFYMALPGALLLLLTSRRRPHRLLLSGFLFFVVLQQGGVGFACQVFFAAVLCWFVAAEETDIDQPAWLRLGPPLLLLVLLLGSATLARQHGSLLLLAGGALAGAASVALVPRLRQHARAMGPWALRLSLVLVVACALGAGRLAGLQYLQEHGVRYQHADVCKDASRDRGHECFYRGAADLLAGLTDRAPASTEYRMAQGRKVEPKSNEYSWLGLTLPPLLLALAGALLAGRRTTLVAGCGLFFLAICLGWTLPLDAHRWLTTGLPTLASVGQPIKYYNFFVLLPLVLLAGAGLHRLAAALGKSRWAAASTVLWVAAFALLAWPFVQNRAALGELFRLPVEAAPRQPFHQLLQVGQPAWLRLAGPELRRRIQRGQQGQVMLRESGRPLQATEYFNVSRGVGTIDWYGTLLLPEVAVPRRYLLLDGRAVDNPRYRGEAWTLSGKGRVIAVKIRPNTIDLEVELSRPDVVVINQSYLDGFIADRGTVRPVALAEQGDSGRPGLLGIALDSAGRHRVQLRYRPTLILGGLAVSGLSFGVWLVLVIWLWRRPRRP